LNVPEDEVERLAVSLILDNRIKGRIDQVNRLIVLTPSGAETGRSQHAAIDAWSHALSVIHHTCTAKLV